MSDTYTGERRAHLEALAELLPEQGLVSRMIGGDDPMLWVWHPQTGRQTIIFATPSRGGWIFLWAPGGQGRVDELARTAGALRQTLDAPPHAKSR
ncbi:hypothetical protein HTZ77_39625 [Nonomuraea sp. SMC257]|uniref:Uncharacterized protein n=1 Tax=Nonomuraea montanisoli TaxID=2741721 RepID=A0A7Y6IG21_9ACTN|nr:hypothetical protein [Nonomuraea montanisoli]NUW37467.1 hypothetical protein [Nonomuraea montanisoli]